MVHLSNRIKMLVGAKTVDWLDNIINFPHL